jgi:hypothetical protein
MNKLYEFQREFITELLQTETVSSNLGMQVYQNAARVIRHNTLDKIFPCCKKIVGADYFDQLVLEFIAQHQANDSQLSQIGQHFIAFIQAHLAGNLVPYLADLAHLEWLWHQVFHGKNNSKKKFADYSPSYNNQHIWQQTPHAKLWRSDFALFEIWKMCQPEYQGDYQVQYSDICYLMIIAIEDNMHLLNLTSQEYALLLFLQSPQTFKKIAEHFSQLSAVELEKTLLALFQRYAIIVT